MNIHEYQAKAVLSEFGVPISKGVPVLNAVDAEGARRFDDQVALVGRDRRVVAGDGEAVRFGERERVVQRDQLEDGLEIVETVGALPGHTQRPVDLRVRRNLNHSAGATQQR